MFVWGEVLKFARLYGWKPAGILPPEEADAEERAAWDENDVTNRQREREHGGAHTLLPLWGGSLDALIHW